MKDREKSIQETVKNYRRKIQMYERMINIIQNKECKHEKVESFKCYSEFDYVICKNCGKIWSEYK